jgi:hypothetical protein
MRERYGEKTFASYSEEVSLPDLIKLLLLADTLIYNILALNSLCEADGAQNLVIIFYLSYIIQRKKLWRIVYCSLNKYFVIRVSLIMAPVRQ